MLPWESGIEWRPNVAWQKATQISGAKRSSQRELPGMSEKSKEDWEFRAAKVRESVGGVISELTDDMVAKDILCHF